MVDKKNYDVKIRHLFARNIANNLDLKDEAGKDGIIVANIWNDFVSDKNGNSIRTSIKLNTAIRSISTYLFREAVQTNQSVNFIGDKWESSTVGNGTASTNTRTGLGTLDNTKQKDDSSTQTNANKSSITLIEEPSEVDSSRSIYSIDNSYAKLSKKKAEEKAQKDSRLEKLNGGSGWYVSYNSFKTDLQYARKYTSKILSYIAEITQAEIIVTSALGTGQAGSPHQKHGYASHHNAENPKLDLKAKNLSLKQLEKKLKETGFFSRVSREKTHLDVQIKPEVYLAFEQNLSGKEVSGTIKNNQFDKLQYI